MNNKIIGEKDIEYKTFYQRIIDNILYYLSSYDINKIKNISYSEDNNLILLNDINGNITIWNVENGTFVSEIHGSNIIYSKFWNNYVIILYEEGKLQVLTNKLDKILLDYNDISFPLNIETGCSNILLLNYNFDSMELKSLTKCTQMDLILNTIEKKDYNLAYKLCKEYKISTDIMYNNFNLDINNN